MHQKTPKTPQMLGFERATACPLVLRKEGEIKLSIKFIDQAQNSCNHVHDAAGHHNHLSNGLAIELGQSASVLSDDVFHVYRRH